MTTADVPVSEEFRLRLRAALLRMLPHPAVEFTLQGDVTVNEQKDNELSGHFCLGAFLNHGDGSDISDMPADPVEGTFTVTFHDPNDIPMNARLQVDLHSYPE